MYKNARYITFGGVSKAIVVDINGVPSSVPLDPGNSDYRAIMALVEVGKLTIADAA